MEEEISPSEPASLISATFSTIAGISNLLPQQRSYLSYRACGFSIREACALAKVNEGTVRRWRVENQDFKILDQELVGQLIESFSHKYLEIEYLRNYRMVLRKDFDVIIKSIAKPDELSQQEQQYLLRARSHYTPEQLAILKRFADAGVSGEDWTTIVQNFYQQNIDQRKVVIEEKSKPEIESR